MKKQQQPNEGFGTSIPPDMSHVIIYFLQKGKSEHEAKTFYANYSVRKWLNLKGNQIKDWKVHAWEWIWSRPSTNKKAAD